MRLPHSFLTVAPLFLLLTSLAGCSANVGVSNEGSDGVYAGGTETSSEPRGSFPVDPVGVGPVNLGPQTEACESASSISAILAQRASDSTAIVAHLVPVGNHSNMTPMGLDFEKAARGLPISSKNSSSLSTPSSNPTVAEATSAQGLEWKRVPVTLYPRGAPSPEDVIQHDIDDCDGVSGLASLAYVNPNLVRSLITDNGDGTFNVAMRDPAGQPITVAVNSDFLVETENPNNLGQVSADDGAADWATVLEKAVMKYDFAYGIRGEIDGIASNDLIPMFTGNGDSVRFLPGSLSAVEFQQVVTVALAAGEFMTGGFSRALSIGSDDTITSHGYAVVAPTDPNKDLADMRNPWGVNPWAGANGYDKSTDGILQIPRSTSSIDWATIVDLRLSAAPDEGCTGVKTPFVPVLNNPEMRIWIHDPHPSDVSSGAHG